MARRSRPGLLGLAARTAVVTGTASAVQRSSAQKQAAAQAQAAPAAAAPAAPAAAAPAENDLAAGIQKLADLHRDGILTDAEFSAAKARLIG